MAEAAERASWRNRITGHAELDPNQLLANPRNWRIHPKQQQQALETVLDDIGWVGEILVNERTGFVIDGHLRIALALRRDEQSVPVTLVDLTESEEMQVLATLDPIAAMAVTDQVKLDETLRAIDGESASMRELLDSLSAQERELGAGGHAPAGGSGTPYSASFSIIVECEDEMTQLGLLTRFQEEGLKCRALLS